MSASNSSLLFLGFSSVVDAGRSVQLFNDEWVTAEQVKISLDANECEMARYYFFFHAPCLSNSSVTPCTPLTCMWYDVYDARFLSHGNDKALSSWLKKGTQLPLKARVGNIGETSKSKLDFESSWPPSPLQASLRNHSPKTHLTHTDWLQPDLYFCAESMQSLHRSTL